MISDLLLLFLGIMAGQFLYMCSLWMQHKRIEYGYYVIHYIILLYFFFSVSYTFFFPAQFIEKHSSFFSLLGFHPLHIFNFYLYIKFAQRYLDAPKNYPYLNKVAVNFMRGIWIAFVVTLIAWFSLEKDSKLFVSIYMGIYIFLKLWAVWVLYVNYKQHTPETMYIVKATIFLSGGLICIYTLIALADAGIIPKTGWNFVPCIIGVLGEIYIINAALNYKTSIQRRKLIETQKQWITELERNKLLLLQKENVVQNLSTELNKEVGTTLNAIGLFAEHSIQQSKTMKPEGIQSILKRIICDSKQMVSNMNDIVWVLSPDNDQLTKAVQRLQSFTLKQSKDLGLEQDFSNNCANAQATMSMEDRKALYTGYKDIFKSFTKYISNRVIVKISGDCNTGISLIFEGMKAKYIENESIRIPSTHPGFQFTALPNNEDNYLRLSCIYKLHPTGVLQKEY